MSVLIAYKRGQTVYMGADNVSISRGEVRKELSEHNYKIQRLENGMLVGVTDNDKIRQIVKGYPDIFTLDKKGKLTRKHLVEEIIPCLIILLGENGLLDEEEKRSPRMDACMFLAHKGELFEICSGFSVYKYEDYQAIGSMADFAQYALYKTEPNDDVNAKIVEALECVARYSSVVEPPFVLIDTEKLEYTVVGGE